MIMWPLKVVCSLAEVREWGNHVIFQYEKTETQTGGRVKGVSLLCLVCE